MEGMKKLTLISTSLYVLSNLAECHSNLPLRSFQKEVKFGNKSEDPLYGLSEVSNDFYYADCVVAVNNSSRICKVTVEIPVSENLIFKKSCNVTQAYDDNGTLQLHPLSHKKVLLVFHSHDRVQPTSDHKVTIHIIQMIDCRVVGLSVPSVKTLQVNTRNYEDVFDVLYTTTNKGSNSLSNCQNYTCRVTYSSAGKVVRGPYEYLRKPNVRGSPGSLLYDHWRPLLLRDSESAPSIQYAAAEFYQPGKKYRVDRLYRVHNGIATELFRKNASFLGLSTSHWKASFCLVADGDVICKQYDSEGHLLVNFSARHSEYSAYEDGSVLWQPFNLQDGGFIVLIVELSASEEFGTKLDALRIVEVENDGRYSFPLEIPYGNLNFTCGGLPGRLTYPWQPFFAATEDAGQICLKFICSNHPGDSGKYVKYRSECVPKSYFDYVK